MIKNQRIWMCRYVQADRQESLCLDSKLIYLPLDSGTLVFAYVPRNQFTRRNHWKTFYSLFCCGISESQILFHTPALGNNPITFVAIHFTHFEITTMYTVRVRGILQPLKYREIDLFIAHLCGCAKVFADKGPH